MDPFTLPPSSQSHFAKFQNFTPNDDASFNDEFSRLASSQQWIPGSQQYSQERTVALREELKLHYFTPSQPSRDKDVPVLTAAESTKKMELEGYQSLCREVGISEGDTALECQVLLKNTLVNIVDLIDARRTNAKVEVWDDFEAFRAYTLQDEHRINMKEAKEGEGYLESLLQKLWEPGQRSRRVKDRKRNRSKTRSGRPLGVSKVKSRDRNHARRVTVKAEPAEGL